MEVDGRVERRSKGKQLEDREDMGNLTPIVLALLAGVFISVVIQYGCSSYWGHDTEDTISDRDGMVDSLLKQCRVNEADNKKDWCEDPEQLYAEIKLIQMRRNMKQRIASIKEAHMLERTVSKMIREHAGRIQTRLDMFDELMSSLCDTEANVIEMIQLTETRLQPIQEVLANITTLKQSVEDLNRTLFVVKTSVVDGANCTHCEYTETWYQYWKTIFRPLQYFAILMFFAAVNAKEDGVPFVFFSALFICIPFLLYYLEQFNR